MPRTNYADENLEFQDTNAYNQRNLLQEPVTMHTIKEMDVVASNPSQYIKDSNSEGDKPNPVKRLQISESEKLVSPVGPVSQEINLDLNQLENNLLLPLENSNMISSRNVSSNIELEALQPNLSDHLLNVEVEKELNRLQGQIFSDTWTINTNKLSEREVSHGDSGEVVKKPVEEFTRPPGPPGDKIPVKDEIFSLMKDLSFINKLQKDTLMKIESKADMEIKEACNLLSSQMDKSENIIKSVLRLMNNFQNGTSSNVAVNEDLNDNNTHNIATAELLNPEELSLDKYIENCIIHKYDFDEKQFILSPNNSEETVLESSNIEVSENLSPIKNVHNQDQSPKETLVNEHGDQVVLVGAASKGIIQREYQHNAMVYKSPYSKNPFDNITEQDLEEYKKIVERKQREEIVEEDVPDEIKPLLVEPVAQQSKPQAVATPPASKSPPSSPYTKSKDSDNVAMQRAISSRLAEQAPLTPPLPKKKMSFFRRTFSERKPKTKSAQVVNGQKTRSHETADVSITSQSSKEGSPTKDLSESSRKDKEKEKKKKGGIKAPSFLKSKKKHKKEKEKEKKEKGASEM